ncbi:MAG: ABC transporter ATP-binding protein, partial [Micromonosporaceae bacterium]
MTAPRKAASAALTDSGEVAAEVSGATSGPGGSRTPGSSGSASRPAAEPPPGKVLECRGVGVSLVGAAGRTEILSEVSFSVARGEFISILGTSGTGKTTLLRALGGLQDPSGGELRCNDARIDGPPPDVVTVFQDYSHSLLPWRTVRRNVALGIEGTCSRAECRRRVDDALRLVGLADSANEYPWRLSGGMQQRVQIARAVAIQPSVLLMDEPFGALDAMTKESLQDELQRLQEATGVTVAFVTHDVDEAVYLSDRVLVLEGKPATVGLELDVQLPRPRDQEATKGMRE